MLETVDKPRAFLGLASLAPFAMMFALLLSFGAGGTFETLVVFFIVLTFSLLMAYMVFDRELLEEPINWLGKKKEAGRERLRETLDISDLKWIIIGILGLLGGMVFFGYLVAPIVGLAAGGAILAWLLIKTENIIVPWMAHAGYNIIAVAAAFGYFSAIGIPQTALNTSPIFIPLFNFSGAEANNFLSQSIIQFFAVSFSEEMMKVALANGILLLAYASNVGRGAALGISALLWVILHTVISFRL